MKNYSRPVSIISRIAEIILWIGAFMMICGFACSFIDPSAITQPMAEVIEGPTEIMGLSINNGFGDTAIIRWIMVYTFFSLTLYAMITRNIALISSRLAKSAQFDEEHSPFNKDTVRMVREIGIFSILQCALSFLFSIALRTVSNGVMETGASLNGLFLGIVVLYLSSIFAYGWKLQKDVNGLV